MDHADDDDDGLAEGVVMLTVLLLAVVLRETAAVEAAAAFVPLALPVAAPIEGKAAASLDGVAFVGVAAVGPVAGGTSEVVSKVKSPQRRLPRPSVKSPRPKRACTSGSKGGGVAEEAGPEDVLLLLLLLLLLEELVLLLLPVVVTMRKVLGDEGVMAPGGRCVPLVNKV